MNDTQFMDQMGSPYLLAHGLGKPVADAKTSFSVENGVVKPVRGIAYGFEQGAASDAKKADGAKARRFKVMVRTMN